VQRQGTALQAAEKAALVIPKPASLRVRDLLFAKRPRKKQIPHPVKNQTGFGTTCFHFFRSLFRRAVSNSYQPASVAEGRLTGRNTNNDFGLKSYNEIPRFTPAAATKQNDPPWRRREKLERNKKC
jgi:hypothetical protein